jgi:hypothetical protein
VNIGIRDWELLNFIMLWLENGLQVSCGHLPIQKR